MGTWMFLPCPLILQGNGCTAKILFNGHNGVTYSETSAGGPKDQNASAGFIGGIDKQLVVRSQAKLLLNGGHAPIKRWHTGK